MTHLARKQLGRWELLAWLNDFLRLDYHKIEELSDAVAFCHLLDAVFPGKVPINRLNFSAKTHSERAANLKVLEKSIKVGEQFLHNECIFSIIMAL